MRRYRVFGQAGDWAECEAETDLIAALTVLLVGSGGLGVARDGWEMPAFFTTGRPAVDIDGWFAGELGVGLADALLGTEVETIGECAATFRTVDDCPGAGASALAALRRWREKAAVATC